MTGDDFDLLFVADARFPGGTSTALANEIEAAHRAGFTAGLLHVNGPVLRRPRVFHPSLRAAIDQRKIHLVDPAAGIRCRLAIVHHPMLFPKPLQRPVQVAAEHALLVAHHPAFDGTGQAQYDIGQQLASLEASLGLCAQVTPVGPQVRAGLVSTRAPLTRADWHNLIDPGAWRRPFRRFGDPIVIGRHARPDPLKWPDRRGDILGAYPDHPRFRVEVLGGGPFLPELVGGIPSNWHVQEFGAEAPREFLARLDAYVYFHSDRWIEAFGYSVLEALASGLPTILPPSFKKLFGPAALYGRPDQTRQMLEILADSEKKQREQRQLAIETVRQRFSLNQFARRLDQLYGLRPRKSSQSRRASAPTRRTALFVSSNGVGLGHLTRQMAIARALPAWIEPVFFTLSRAARLVSEAGYLVEHVPFHRYLGTTPECWNPIFERELAAALRFYRPAALLFDGNVPYAGLLGAMRSRPEMLSFWIRRGMWRDHHGGIIGRADRFDAVIEPRDLAEADDNGPTSTHRGKVVSVDPILLIAPQRRIPRAEARAALAIEDGRVAISLQLGAGNNFDFSKIRRQMLERLLAEPDVEVIELVSPISESKSTLRPVSPRHRIRRMYPAYQYSRAFDAAISAAGYNSFHENVLGGLPTLFVANRAEEMDRQDLRGDYAERMGLGWSWNEESAAPLGEKLAQLLDPAQRRAVRRRVLALAATDGARQAARFVVEMLMAAR